MPRSLDAGDPAMPPDLQQGLLDIADLTTESAHEQVLSIAYQQQLSLFTVNARTTPENLAFAIGSECIMSASTRIDSCGSLRRTM